MSDYVDTVDIEGTQYDIQDTATKQQAEENAQNIAEIKVAIDYSLTEHLTGRKWLDGRPTYEKTIDCGALPNATAKNVSHGISNLLFIIRGSITATVPGSGQYIPTTLAPPQPSGAVSFYADNTNLVIMTGVNRSNFAQTFITLEYTKSTDTPQP